MIKIIPVEDLGYNTDLIKHSKRTKHEQHVTNCIVKRYGQFKPILVEYILNEYFLVAGNDILRALKDLGITHAICFVFENLTAADSITINMIENQSRNVDVLRMAKMLEEMLKHGEVNYKGLANVLHHTRDEIHNFKQLKEFNWEDFDNNPAHYQTSLF
jgi:hypothetical protein